VFRVSEVPIAKIVVINSGDSVAGSSAEGMFTVEVYQRVPSVIDEFNRSGVFVSKVMSRDVVSGLSNYGVPLCGAFYAGREVISGTAGNSGEGSLRWEGYVEASHSDTGIQGMMVQVSMSTSVILVGELCLMSSPCRDLDTRHAFKVTSVCTRFKGQ
jgi:hypothetical protein